MDRFCGTCKKEVKDIEPAQCSYCENYFHVKAECSDVTRSNMTMFFISRKALWLCTDCRGIFSNRTLKSVLHETEEGRELTRLQDQIEALTKSVTDLQQQVSDNLTAVMEKLEKCNPLTKTPKPASYAGIVSGGAVETSSSETGRVGRKPLFKRCTITGTADVNLQEISVTSIAVEPKPPRFWLYLTGLNPKITIKDVKLIVERCLQTNLDRDPMLLVRKNVDCSRYSFVSYRIGLDPALREKALDANSWPKNLGVREFDFLDSDSKNRPATMVMYAE